MANRFWVGGTGSWSATNTANWSATSGGAGGASVPGGADPVFFDANSGTGTAVVTITAAANANTFVTTGFTGTIVGSSALTCGGSVVTLASETTINTFSLTLSRTIASSTVALRTNGKTLTTLVISPTNNAGIKVQLADALTLTGVITHTSGEFDTAGFAVTAAGYASSGGNSRTLTLGSSAITMTGTTAWSVTFTGSGFLTVTANTAVVTMTGAATFTGSTTVDYNGMSLVFTGPGAVTIASFVGGKNLTRTGTASKTDTFVFSSNTNISGTLTVTANSAVNRVLIQSNLLGTSRYLSFVDHSFSNVDFQDIIVGRIPPWTLGGTGGNLLTANQSSLETDTTGWRASSNCSIARTTAVAEDGSASLAITATAAGTVIASSDAPGYVIPIIGGRPYTLSAVVRSAAAARTMVIAARWTYSDGTADSTATTTGSVVASTTGGQLISTAVLAPPNATGVYVRTQINSAQVGEVFYVDKIGVWSGEIDLSAIPGGSGDALGNLGIVFTPPATQYWVGQTNFLTVAAGWASSSGGVGGSGRMPLPQDDIVLDANSFTASTQTLTVNMPRMCRNFDGSAAVGRWSLNAATSIFGNVKGGPGLNRQSWVGGLTLYGRGSHTIDENGTVNGILVSAISAAGFNGLSYGTYTLLSNLTSAAAFSLVSGALDLNGFTFTCTTFTSTATAVRALLMPGVSTMVLTTSGTVWSVTSASFTLTMSATATISATNIGSSSRTLALGGVTYDGIISIVATTAASSVTLGGGATIGTFSVAASTAARTLTFTAGSTYTVTNWDVRGASGALVSLLSSAAGSQFSLVKAGGGVATADYLSVKDVAATPASTWYAGTNSTDAGNNTGWSFTSVVQTSAAAQSLAAPASLQTTPTANLYGSEDLASPAVLTVAAVRSTFAATPLIAPANLIGSSTRTTDGAVALRAGALLTSTASQGSFGQASLVAPATLVTGGTRTTQATQQLGAPAAISATATLNATAVVLLNGAADLESSAQQTIHSAVALTAPASMSPDAIGDKIAAAQLDSPASLSTASGLTATPQVSTNAPAALSATARVSMSVQAVLTSPASISSSAIWTTSGTVSLPAPGGLVTSPVATMVAVSPLAAPAGLVATARIQSFVGASLLARGSLSPVVIRTASVGTSLNSPAGLTAAAVRQVFGSAVLNAPVQLTTAHVASRSGTALLRSSTTMVVTASILRQAGALLLAAAKLSTLGAVSSRVILNSAVHLSVAQYAGYLYIHEAGSDTWIGRAVFTWDGEGWKRRQVLLHHDLTDEWEPAL